MATFHEAGSSDQRMRLFAIAAVICAGTVLGLRAQAGALGADLSAVALAEVEASAKAAVDLTALLDSYYQGRHDEAVAKAAALPELGPLRLQFVQGTPAWINADPANAEKRR